MTKAARRRFMQEHGCSWQAFGDDESVLRRKRKVEPSSWSRADHVWDNHMIVRSHYVKSAPDGEKFKYKAGTYYSSKLQEVVFDKREDAVAWCEWLLPAKLKLDADEREARDQAERDREEKQRLYDSECAARAKRSQKLLEQMGASADVQIDGRIVIEPAELERLFTRSCLGVSEHEYRQELGRRSHNNDAGRE